MPTAAGIHFFLHEAAGVTSPPLVLIHDAGGDHLSWPSEIRRLPGMRVYSIDLPGHGKNVGLGRQYVEEYAHCLVEFLNSAGLSRAVFGGHGMGGAIALTLALDHPGRAAGIVLLSTGPRLPIPSDILENGANSSTLPRAIHAIQEISFHGNASEDLRDSLCKHLTETRKTLLYGDWLACNRFDVKGRIKSIRTPTLVICGTGDRLTPLHFSETLASGIPGAALQTVDRAGHMLITEQPVHVANLISIFLKTVPYTPGM